MLATIELNDCFSRPEEINQGKDSRSVSVDTLSCSEEEDDMTHISPKLSCPPKDILHYREDLPTPSLNLDDSIGDDLGLTDGRHSCAASFTMFRLQYILAYIGIMLADGLQGTRIC